MANQKNQHLLNHLQNADFRDAGSRIVIPVDDGRLRPVYTINPGGWRAVAAEIFEAASDPIMWLPDTNVVLLDQAEAVWTSLRLAAIGRAFGSVLLTGVVYEESKAWLEDPFHHKERARDLQEALSGGTWARLLLLDKNSKHFSAIAGYISLLRLRRMITQPVTTDGLTLLGTDPALKSETMNAIGNQIGARAQGLAKKGRVDIERSGSVNITDEAHCLMAIANALVTGTDSIILTADEDFLEIFWKAQWFLDTHYRAWLAAKLIAAGKYGNPVGTCVDEQGNFDGPITLYRRYTNHLREVLPASYRRVFVGVIYVAPDGSIHRLGFSFEREMTGMLETRSATKGRCTDLFDNQNIHVDLGPINPGRSGMFMGIGVDAGNWRTFNDTKCFLSSLDVVHVMNCQERYTVG